MSLTESDVRKLVRSKDGGVIEGVYGPNTLSDAAIWEVWTTVDGVFTTRFVAEPSSGTPLYFSGFEQLCGYLHRRIASELRERLELRIRMVTLAVAAMVFVATVFTLLYLVVKSGDTSSLLLTAILGVVASGSALFFGKWLPFGPGKKDVH